jgi:predicted outer membrane repeat protein
MRVLLLLALMVLLCGGGDGENLGQMLSPPPSSCIVYLDGAAKPPQNGELCGSDQMPCSTLLSAIEQVERLGKMQFSDPQSVSNCSRAVFGGAELLQVVVVASVGLYQGVANRNVSVDLADVSLNVRANIYGNGVLFDGQNQSAILQAHGRGALSLSSISFLNGHSGGDNVDGGCLRLRSGELIDVAIVGCVFELCSAHRHGGAIAFVGRVDDDSTASLPSMLRERTSAFLDQLSLGDNIAYLGSGGAVYADKRTALAVQSCVFERNDAAHNGGAVSCLGTLGGVHGSQFEENVAARGAGGALAAAQLGSAIAGSQFVDNRAAMGGAVALLGERSYGARIEHVLFFANVAWAQGDVGGGGGALLIGASAGVTGEPMALLNVTFASNRALAGPGGALMLRGYVPMRALACQFRLNEALGGCQSIGGAVAMLDGASLSMSDSVLLDNVASGFGGAIGCANNTAAQVLGRVAMLSLADTFMENNVAAGSSGLCILPPLNHSTSYADALYEDGTCFSSVFVSDSCPAAPSGGTAGLPRDARLCAACDFGVCALDDDDDDDVPQCRCFYAELPASVVADFDSSTSHESNTLLYVGVFVFVFFMSLVLILLPVIYAVYYRRTAQHARAEQQVDARHQSIRFIYEEESGDDVNDGLLVGRNNSNSGVDDERNGDSDYDDDDDDDGSDIDDHVPAASSTSEGSSDVHVVVDEDDSDRDATALDDKANMMPLSAMPRVRQMRAERRRAQRQHSPYFTSPQDVAEPGSSRAAPTSALPIGAADVRTAAPNYGAIPSALAVDSSDTQFFEIGRSPYFTK